MKAGIELVGTPERLGGIWWWRVVASNGRVLTVSETYDSKGNALRAARRFLKIAPSLVWGGIKEE